MTNLADIEGIGEASRTKLKGAGIDTVEELLDKGATPAGRGAIADASGISGKLILEWVNLADLMRIKGVGSELSDLLEEAGVDTVKELAGRVPANLHAKLGEINTKKKLVRQLPSLGQVETWVKEAKSLPPKVSY